MRSRLKKQTNPLATTIITVEEHLRGWLALITRNTADYAQVHGLRFESRLD